ncbi:hypothetical protein FQN57_004135 [Myotisia sp. PD_48]|nr:hypothetical protein FQN57_004135 [Myotisia sp. PD_48]
MPSSSIQTPSHTSAYQPSSHSASTSAQQSSTSLSQDPALPPTKRDLASWWKQFKRGTKKDGSSAPPSGIFGTPLNVSIKYANVAISLAGEDGKSFIYGYVPIVVAKCGVFLKEKATDVEGIFRLSGSAKRIKDLQEIFNSPPQFGKGLDWAGYTVHDAANILRRYLNQLPEPIVPLEFYERFRDLLRHRLGRQDGEEAAAQVDEANGFKHAEAVPIYQRLIKELPPLNRQLLLYILDLLTVFASKSDLNRMTAANLAAIFQPGMLSHPAHDMSPQEYKLSQDVIVFLIENQDNFLFGMTGTAADEQTMKDVQGGIYVSTPQKSSIRRSVSNASGGGESLRRYEAMRRNLSISSRHSKNSGGNVTSPTTPKSIGGGSMGVHRSNTLPSKRTGFSPNAFIRHDSHTTTPSINPSPGTPLTLPPQPPSRSHSRTPPVITPNEPAGTPTTETPPSNSLQPSPKPAKEIFVPPSSLPQAETPGSEFSTPKPLVTPTRERKLTSFFAAWSSPPDEKRDGRPTNRLKKKRRIPGSESESAQSSTHSLHAHGADELSQQPPVTSQPATGLGLLDSTILDESNLSTPKASNVAAPQEIISSTTSSSHTHGNPETSSSPHRTTESGSLTAAESLTDGMLKPPLSRTPSPLSATDQSDLDEATKAERREKRRSWRFARSKKTDD